MAHTKESILNVRFKPSLRNWLDRRARKDGRASSREVEFLLEEIRKSESERRG